MPRLKRKLSDIQDLELELSTVQDACLRHAGWAHTSDSPGCVWVWTREYKGKTLMVSRDTALFMQRSYFAVDPHDWVTDDEGVVSCSKCEHADPDFAEFISEECKPTEVD